MMDYETGEEEEEEEEVVKINFEEVLLSAFPFNFCVMQT